MPGRISELTALVMAVLSQCKYETDGVYRGTIEWEEKEKDWMRYLEGKENAQRKRFDKTDERKTE